MSAEENEVLVNLWLFKKAPNCALCRSIPVELRLKNKGGAVDKLETEDI